MLNVLIPMAGKSQYFPENEYPFPKPLIEIGHKTIVEWVVENLSTASSKVQFIFVINTADCVKFHLDSTLNIITNGQCKIVKIGEETRGSACSALMAIDHIPRNEPLLIANSDQLFTFSISKVIAEFYKSDAGVVTFDSVHPRWSYVRLDEERRVVEAAEKHPLSRHAIAGLYYFRCGADFIEAAMQMIRKDESVNGSYFIAPILNQMILSGKEIKMYKISNDTYHTFYTPKKIKEYENLQKIL
ncbi:glycosyltransferase family 2 protein [Endozoicomonas gorgoniicola]|uniref:Glycosyltransferase family 2 protein n=1 Tax=Endozoicomonas gorgoniicola TaxID=1234144 RepID=A0ABT3MS45_9GAMM|nr:glycosyltransferase family 2 protein [Endozoicomonas gorgoniicola]MCW7552198.1 glycosyltransferase family 2 protein [Endozoicomonas gorgoniicola]